MLVHIIEPLQDEGTVVVFAAVDDDGDIFKVAVDHGCAPAIISALDIGEDVEAEVEPWQVL